MNDLNVEAKSPSHCHEETKEDEDEENTDKKTTTHGEVNFSAESVHGEHDDQEGGGAGSDEDDLPVIEHARLHTSTKTHMHS